MFKKQEVRQIIDCFKKILSDAGISGVLGVSRNSVAPGSGRFPRARQGMGMTSQLMSEMNYIISFILIKVQTKAAMPRRLMRISHSESVRLGSPECFLGGNTGEKCKNGRGKACSYLHFAKVATKIYCQQEFIPACEHKPGVTLEVDWSGPT